MKRSNVYLLVVLLLAMGQSSWGQVKLVPLTDEIPYARRNTPYGVVYYSLTKDENAARAMLSSIREMGATRALTLAYWWQAETLGGDYWKKEYRSENIGEGYYKSLDLYVRISRELGLKPAMRLGGFREWNGLWHPADPSGSVEHYAAWVEKLAARYRGQVDHYIIADEENTPFAPAKYDGSAQAYFQRMFVPLAKAIRKGDPEAKISTCGVSSAPATDWLLELIKLGLPRYGDGVGCNLWHGVVEDTWQVKQFMAAVRKAWPQVKFYSSGVGYVINRGEHDRLQAGITAQTMFTLWDIGWDSASYYLYGASITADTKKNYGLIDLSGGEGGYVRTDAWKAYQTIAGTFYDRDRLKKCSFPITFRAARALTAEDGTTIAMAPPDPVVRAFVREDAQLLIYLAYKPGAPREGTLRLAIGSDQWADPEQIPLLSVRDRSPLKHHYEAGKLILEEIVVGVEPTLITVRRITR
ncbi:MAG: hypothetical protein IT446_00435 [Phycisphaerales bacterium]|nr:hypothetical protein [Phycisphaerales bacterium]